MSKSMVGWMDKKALMGSLIREAEMIGISFGDGCVTVDGETYRKIRAD